MNNRLEKYTKDMLKKLTLDDLLSLIGEREKPKQSYIYENFVKADFSKTVFAGSFANIVDVKNYGVMCCINDGFIALNCYPYKASRNCVLECAVMFGDYRNGMIAFVDSTGKNLIKLEVNKDDKISACTCNGSNHDFIIVGSYSIIQLYKFKIVASADQVKFYVNDTLVHTNNNADTIPTDWLTIKLSYDGYMYVKYVEAYQDDIELENP